MLYDEFDSVEEPNSELSVEELLTYMKTLFRQKIRYVVAIGAVVLFVGYLVVGGSEAETSIVMNEGSEIGTESAPPDDKQIFVDLSGAVEKPGVYEFTNGSRIADLIAVGGPVSNDASALWLSQNLNLAEQLIDTQKIYIPFEWEIANEKKLTVEIATWQNGDTNNTSSASEDSVEQSSNSSSSDNVGGDQTADDGSQKINVNTASQTELESLNGIGKVYSQRIIDNRPYIDEPELKVKANIPESTLSKISDFITF